MARVVSSSVTIVAGWLVCRAGVCDK